MFQLDHSTLVFFCLLGFTLLAPPGVWAVFAVSEVFHRQRKPKTRAVHCLRRIVRR